MQSTVTNLFLCRLLGININQLKYRNYENFKQQ
jgi:hypothetical protein